MPIARSAQTTNSLLRILSAKDNRRLLAHSEHVKLKYGDVLCKAGSPIRHVYFPNDGVISLLTSMDGKANVEVGLVGKEGMAGIGRFLGVSVSPVLMLVQGSGTATRMTAASFDHEIKRNPTLKRELSRYLFVFLAQVSQTAACNRHHLLVKRLARWLLMVHDRVQLTDFYMTQEFLAHMLGVRRVGVTQAARALHSKKLISYSRGKIKMLNRKGLERASCRCYRDVIDIRDHVLQEK